MSNWLRSIALLPLLVVGCATERQAVLPAPPSDLVAVLRDKAGNACNQESATALASRGVAAASIASGFYLAVTSGGREGGRRTGSEAWITLVGQPGSIVIDHDLNCGVRQIYARDGARLPR